MAEAVSLPRVSAPEQPAPGLIGRVWGFFATLARRKPLGFASLLFLIFLGVVALMPGLFATHDPADTNAGPPFQARCLGPSDTFLCPTNEKEDFVTGQTTSVSGSLKEPFGTDQLGRDLYSRVVMAPAGPVHRHRLGHHQLGSFAAHRSELRYIGGAFDSVLQRFIDAFMAIPFSCRSSRCQPLSGAPIWMGLCHSTRGGSRSSSSLCCSASSVRRAGRA
jgi:hypothetical protein